MRYSIFSLARNALGHHEHWPAAWRSPEPKQSYEVVIVGGGGHGLATAYYLAALYGIRDVAVLEKGWLGGGNTGRNTTIIRSNYLWDESAHLYEHSLKLYEGLSRELNFNVMLSQRGVLNLAHNLHDLRELSRRVNAIRLNGIDSEVLTPAQIKALVPILDTSPNARYPVLGASLQRRGGVARHDAVAWGFARGADARGVDVIQNCEVTGIRQRDGTVEGVETSRGYIRAKKVGVVVAGTCERPRGHGRIQAPDREPPVAGARLRADQTDPPFGGDVERGACLRQPVRQGRTGDRGGDRRVQLLRATRQLPRHRGPDGRADRAVPDLLRLKMLRHWAGIVDVCPDASPIISKTPVRNLYFNCGWGTGGFKATPGSGWVFAHTIAHDAPPRAQRRVHPRTFFERCADRRARRRRGRALRRGGGRRCC